MEFISFAKSSYALACACTLAVSVLSAVVFTVLLFEGFPPIFLETCSCALTIFSAASLILFVEIRILPSASLTLATKALYCSDNDFKRASRPLAISISTLTLIPFKAFFIFSISAFNDRSLFMSPSTFANIPAIIT